jgi:integrase
MGQVIRKTKGGRFIGWYIRWREGGKRFCIASKQPTAAAARKMLVQIEAKVARGESAIDDPEAATDSALTVSELCERYLASSHPRVKCPIAYRQKAREGLRGILPLVGTIKVVDLRRRDIEHARDRLSHRYRPNTVRAALRPLSAALNWAVQQELLSQSPMTRFAMPRREQSTEHLSLEDSQRLLQEAEKQVQRGLPYHSFFVGVSLALRLGLRRGEVFGLRWEDVNLQRNRLTVARSYDALPKNGKPRTLPLSAELVKVLSDWRAKCPADQRLVCPFGDSIKHGLAKLLEAAGCPPLSRGWHALRHSFATIWVEQGGSIMTLKDMLGHSTLNMVLVYAHLSPTALAADMAKIKL